MTSISGEADFAPRACVHPSAPTFSNVCDHLWDSRASSASGSHNHYRCYTGRGLDRELLCKSCGEKGPTTACLKVATCEECFFELEESGQCLGDWGRPGFTTKNVGIRLHSSPVPLRLNGAKLKTIAPVEAGPGSRWFALTDGGDLVDVDAGAGETRRLSSISALGLALDQALSLSVSKRGDLALVVETNGATGAVLDYASGEAVMTLNRGDYRVENCNFSAAFFEHDGKTLLVHATAWNRLDICDPRTGQLFTPRELPTYQSGKPLPAHYLDYFHCGLSVSPDQTWIADSGWVWHPYGVVRTWNLKDWTSQNVWESEDGPSVRGVVGRSYFWDGPLCWVDARHLAVWGVGKDDYSLLPAVRVIDVSSGVERAPIIGPLGPSEPAESESVASQNQNLAKNGVLEFDEFLLAWSPAGGLAVWDVNDGTRLFEATDFRPMGYNHATREFFSRGADGSYRLSRLTH